VDLSTIICRLYFVKANIITVNIQNTSPVSPGDVIRIYLPVISQHYCRSSAGNSHTTEGLHLPVTVCLLFQNNGSVPGLQTTLIDTRALYRQRTFTNLMQVIAFNTVNLPVYEHAFIHNNTGTGPGTVV